MGLNVLTYTLDIVRRCKVRDKRKTGIGRNQKIHLLNPASHHLGENGLLSRWFERFWIGQLLKDVHTYYI